MFRDQPREREKQKVVVQRRIFDRALPPCTSLVSALWQKMFWNTLTILLVLRLNRNPVSTSIDLFLESTSKRPSRHGRDSDQIAFKRLINVKAKVKKGEVKCKRRDGIYKE